MDNASRVLERH